MPNCKCRYVTEKLPGHFLKPSEFGYGRNAGYLLRLEAFLRNGKDNCDIYVISSYNSLYNAPQVRTAARPVPCAAGCFSTALQHAVAEWRRHALQHHSAY